MTLFRSEETIEGLSDSALEDLNLSIQREKKKRRHAAVLSESAVDAEVTRLLAKREERRAERLREWEDYKTQKFEQCREEALALRTGGCLCKACLTGYLVRDASRLCAEGRQHLQSRINARAGFLSVVL